MSTQYAGFSKNIWTAIHVVAMVSISLSMLGSLFIVYNTIALHRNHRKKKISMIKYLPMFISLADLSFAIIHISDHSISLHTGYVTNGVGCIILGFGLTISINYIAVMVMSVAIYFFSTIVLMKKPNYGKYAWKLHTFAVTFVILLGLVPFIYDGYGQSGAWCATKMPPYGNVGLTASYVIFNIGYIFVCIVICSVLYSWTYFTLRETFSLNNPQQSQNKITGHRKTTTKLDDLNQNQSNEQTKTKVYKQEAKLARQMNIFVLIYLVQWTPYVIYVCISLSGHATLNPVVTICCVFLTNLGGILNGFAYMFMFHTSNDLSHEKSEYIDSYTASKMGNLMGTSAVSNTVISVFRPTSSMLSSNEAKDAMYTKEGKHWQSIHTVAVNIPEEEKEEPNSTFLNKNNPYPHSQKMRDYISKIEEQETNYGGIYMGDISVLIATRKKAAALEKEKREREQEKMMEDTIMFCNDNDLNQGNSVGLEN